VTSLVIALAITGVVVLLLALIARRDPNDRRPGRRGSVLAWLQRTVRAFLEPLQKSAGAVESAVYTPIGFLRVRGWVRNRAETTAVVVLVNEIPHGFGAFDGGNGSDHDTPDDGEGTKGRAEWSAAIDLPGLDGEQAPVRAIAVTADGLSVSGRHWNESS
jgi:hypothetical protein